jgi:hypothetical protein
MGGFSSAIDALKNNKFSVSHKVFSCNETSSERQVAKKDKNCRNKIIEILSAIRIELVL